MHLSLCHGLHVIADIFCIGDNHRAVIVVLSLAGLLMFIEDTGMENGLDALLYQPFHLTVGQLGRVAFGF